MTTKEYLQQARYLDIRIASKREQILSLNDLATKCTTAYSDMPKSPNRGTSRMEDVILKIISLEEEISEDMSTLVDLKKQIAGSIKAVSNLEYQTILEKRYLCLDSWEQIAVDLGYDLRYLHKLHQKALREVRVPALRIGHEKAPERMNNGTSLNGESMKKIYKTC